MAALFNVLRAVRSAVPWRCTITLLTDNDTAVVGLIRNGRPVGEVTRISRRDLGLPAIPLEGKGKERDDAITRAHGELLTAAAAVILTALSERHRELAHGLCGAKKWKSIARHSIATDQYHDKADVKKPLLEAAVDADQRNAAARVALAHATAGDHPDDLKAESRLACDLDHEFGRIRRRQHSRLQLRLRQWWEWLQLQLRLRLCQWWEWLQLKQHQRRDLQGQRREERRELQVRQREERRERSAPKRGYGSLELRLLYARATVWLNVHLLVEAQGLMEPSPQQAWAHARLVARHLIYRLDEIPKRWRLPWRGEDANINELGSRLRPSASSLWQAIIDHNHGSALPEGGNVQNLIRDWITKEWIPGSRPTPTSPPDPAIPPDKELLSRQACYDWACTLAIKPSADESMLAKALGYLEAATTDDGNRTWARRDPAFAVFRTTDTSPSDELRQRYKDAVGGPLPTDILTLPPLTQHADKLRAYGLTTCERFSETSSWHLASQVGVEPLVARGWVELGTLACRLTTDDSKRIALLKLLTASEITDMQKLLTRLRDDKEALYRQLVKNATDLRIVPTRKETIEAWAKL